MMMMMRVMMITVADGNGNDSDNDRDTGWFSTAVFLQFHINSRVPNSLFKYALTTIMYTNIKIQSLPCKYDFVIVT